MNTFTLLLASFWFIAGAQAQNLIQFKSNNTELNQAFEWAKNKALSYAHDGSDPVGYWYEAALPNREAFCMRDVSHQAIGAEMLGLSKHNVNMLQKFAENISAERDYCSYWEINRYNKPAPVDYQHDKDFWYNLPANFDVLYTAWRLFKWTGNKKYLEDPALKNFYALSMNEYVDHWQLRPDQIITRNRSMYSAEATRFGISRGIPTYNEGGRGETFLGIDLTAAIIAAYKSYSEILKQSGQPAKANEYLVEAKRQQQFLNDFWWDKDRKEFRSILYADKTADYFMVENNQAYLHYLLYFNAINDQSNIKQLADEYRLQYDKLIVELKSYLPIIFYENGYAGLANKMIIDLCSAENKRRDYPENSFTIIEHVTRGLMGIEADASSNSVVTLSRLEAALDWAEMNDVPLLSNRISVRHHGHLKTTFTNQAGPTITWSARIPGNHKFLFVDGIKKQCKQEVDHGSPYSFCNITVESGNSVAVSVSK